MDNDLYQIVGIHKNNLDHKGLRVCQVFSVSVKLCLGGLPNCCFISHITVQEYSQYKILSMYAVMGQV